MYSDVEEPVEVVVSCVVPMLLQVVVVVQDVKVEVTTVLEEPPEAKDVERTTVSTHDGTAVPLEHAEVVVVDPETVLPIVQFVSVNYFVCPGAMLHEEGHLFFLPSDGRLSSHGVGAKGP